MLFIGALVSGIALSCEISKHIDSGRCQKFHRVDNFVPIINRLCITVIPVEKPWGKITVSAHKISSFFHHQTYRQAAHMAMVIKSDRAGDILWAFLGAFMCIWPKPLFDKLNRLMA
jgi:hypothetical protein